MVLIVVVVRLGEGSFLMRSETWTGMTILYTHSLCNRGYVLLANYALQTCDYIRCDLLYLIQRR